MVLKNVDFSGLLDVAGALPCALVAHLGSRQYQRGVAKGTRATLD